MMTHVLTAQKRQPQMIMRKSFHRIVSNDRRIFIAQIANSVAISNVSVQTVLTDILRMTKLCARCVPRMLTPDQKLTRLETPRKILARLETNPINFSIRFVTQDDTWVHHFALESEIKSKQWKHFGLPFSKKFRQPASVIAFVFWDSDQLLAERPHHHMEVLRIRIAPTQSQKNAEESSEQKSFCCTCSRSSGDCG